MSLPRILVIDQGTSSTRAVLFCNETLKPIAQTSMPIQQHYPHNGWVEQDPEEIWQSVLSTIKSALKKAQCSIESISAIGLCNQRETVVMWDKKTDQPLGNAILWQDRRTHKLCQKLKDAGHEDTLRAKTGLCLDPYFSASKIHWQLEHYENAQALIENGCLAVGTIDSYLLWKLSGGTTHATDITNASRTLLFNIHSCQWDNDCLKLFSIPQSILPEVKASNAHFSDTAADILGQAIPILGIAGDQQAASLGQSCLKAGEVKSTYGTGCFMMMNTGDTAAQSQNLLTTIAYQIDESVSYALEGSIFDSGSVIGWLKDKLGLISNPADTESMAAKSQHIDGLYMIPAFTGLGAPYWNPKARAAIVGMTRDTNSNALVRATLEAIAYQSQDLLVLFNKAASIPVESVRVDGGMVANNWLCQNLADQLNTRIERIDNIEATAQGTAYLVALNQGRIDLSALQAQERQVDVFLPKLSEQEQQQRYSGWKRAVAGIQIC